MFEELREKEEITISNLAQKVNDLLSRFEESKLQNHSLRQEMVTLKAQSEAKTIQIEKLEKDLKSKNIESDEIFERIEEVLRR